MRRLPAIPLLFTLLLPEIGLCRNGWGRGEPRHSGRGAFVPGPLMCLGSFHFGTLTLLSGERAVLHIDAYPPRFGRPSEECQVLVQFVFEDVVLQEGVFTLAPNRTLDVAFFGPAEGATEFRPVISPIGRCNLDVVPLLQVEEQAPVGSGKTLYVYPGQLSVSLRCLEPAPADCAEE